LLVRKRYHVSAGVIIRRRPLPSGDVIITLLGSEGKWSAVARAGKNSPGLAATLSLFDDVTVQSWRRNSDDLALITQVQLNGALPRLSEPGLYPFAHVLAELTDSLTVDVQIGEPLYEYLTSGLRGLCQHDDPERIALLYSWKMLQVAGLSPRTRQCASCGSTQPPRYLAVAAGALQRGSCPAGHLLDLQVAADLKALLDDPVRKSLELQLQPRQQHWLLLERYLGWHVTPLRSLERLAPQELQHG
jgi:DNA repair protein RecO (recombination protein O)